MVTHFHCMYQSPLQLDVGQWLSLGWWNVGESGTWHICTALSTPMWSIISPRRNAGGLAQRAEVIFAAGRLPFRSLTMARLPSRRLTPDALLLLGLAQPHLHCGEETCSNVGHSYPPRKVSVETYSHLLLNCYFQIWFIWSEVTALIVHPSQMSL